MKKFVSIAMAIVMLAVISGTAFAGTIGEGGIDDTGENVLTFTKSILMKNRNASYVREPGITYTYTITEIGTLAEGETVTDKDDHAGIVYKLSVEGGDIDDVLPTQTAQAVFADTSAVATSAEGVETSKDVTFTFVGSKFPHAGIYRFIVTETTSVTTKASVGITENDGYSDTMYLDVYVQGKGDDTKIYAYVLFENNEAAIAAGSVAARQKSAGWCGGPDGTVNQDIYETYDLEVKKVIEGDTTSQSNQFPFTVSLKNASLATKVDLTLSSSNATFDGTPDSDDAGSYAALSSAGTDVKVKLANEGTVTITGIPAGTTATVKEKNNTYDFYTLKGTVSNSSTDDIEDVDGALAPGADSDVSPAISIDGETKTAVLFTNKLTTISPTGYVARYAPYALMLIAGIALLIIAKKHKKHTDEE